MTTPITANGNSQLLSLVNEVDRFIIQSEVKAKFHLHVDQFCQMVERYAEEYEKQEKPIREYKKDIERIYEQYQGDSDGLSNAKGKIEQKHCQAVRLLNYEAAPKPGMVKSYDHWMCSYIDRPTPETFWIWPEPVNLLPWLGPIKNMLLGVSTRKPTEAEKVMCDYVLLAIVHDEALDYYGSETARLHFPRNELSSGQFH